MARKNSARIVAAYGSLQQSGGSEKRFATL